MQGIKINLILCHSNNKTIPVTSSLTESITAVGEQERREEEKPVEEKYLGLSSIYHVQYPEDRVKTVVASYI